MAIQVRDEHLEKMIDAERESRGDATMAKTLGDLARERLIALEQERLHAPAQEREDERTADPATA